MGAGTDGWDDATGLKQVLAGFDSEQNLFAA